ncbi:Bug family tripartite tricarboxylate transporter substrate binding protein [Marinobacter sp. JSM 1782161]|uniref:Bug family tripartite tricarboxylate transporter substrate binding protein n=1 Tax=Marinobacter sp. JSM 1782161 TaxID=2685906 RepID=UPI001402A36B|nr:tripartite tricarboxylate transporter substrate binding protein [Marinobacter sp. JSM 1782161]
MSLKKSIMTVLAATALFSPTSFAATDYPTRDIDLVVGYSAGGSTDILARTIAPYIQNELGGDQSITVINRPGGSGEIAYTEMARAQSDGYTLSMVNMPGVINPIIERSPDYQLDDFTFLGNVIFDPTAIFVGANSEFETLEQWVDYAKENGKSVTVGNPGRGGAQHTSFERFLMAAGVDVNNIPFNGGARSRAALLGGHISAAVMGLSEAAGNVKSGDIRVLAVMADERSPLLPDVPTLKELGYDLVGGSYRGLMAPADIDSDVADKLRGAIADMMEDPKFTAEAKKRLFMLNYMTAAEQKDLTDTLYEDMSNLWDNKPWVEK